MRRLALLIIGVAVVAALILPAAAFGEGFIFDSTYGGPGTAIGQFSQPGAITTANGEVFIADTSNNRVQVFTIAGAFVRSWAGVASPIGIFVDRARGLVYVSEWSAGDVKVFDRAGNLVRTIGSPGSGDGQLNQPYQIAVDSSGNVYVADRVNARINVFTVAGAPLRRWGSAGTGPGQFSQVTGIAIDSDDNVYTYENAGCRVQKFDTLGTPTGSAWGSFGALNEQFGFNDYFLAVASDGNVLVADNGNDAIKEWEPDGTFVRAITHANLDNPVGVTVTANRTLFTSSITSQTISRFDWDDTAPVITHDYDGEWHSQPFTVHFSAVDDFTAVPWLRWTTNMVDWTNDGSVVVNADATTHAWDGIFKPTIGAGDSVSNWAYKALKIKVDTRAPISTVSGVPAGWTSQEVDAYIAATDIGSGLNRSFYDLDGAGLTELPASGIVAITDPGLHTLQYWSQDNCADTPNQEDPKTVTVRIDQMGPMAFPRFAVSVKRGSFATFKYGLDDDFSSTCTVKLVIKKKNKVVKTVNLGVKDSAFKVPEWRYAKRIRIGLAAGVYNWTVVATDQAGNMGSYTPKKLTVK